MLEQFHHDQFRASDHVHDGMPHLLLASSGSVATIKLPNILQALSKYKISIRVILTPSAANFLQAQSHEQPSLTSLAAIPNVHGIYQDADEWQFGTGEQRRGWIRGDPILHIELRRWADVMLIAPLSANMLAKIVGGMAEGLVSSVVRAWDTTGKVDGIRPLMCSSSAITNDISMEKCKRILVAPAMNTAMWRQPITARQIAVLEKEWGVGALGNSGEEGWFEVLRPQEKELACGDVGDGAMKDWHELVTVVVGRLGIKTSGDN